MKLLTQVMRRMLKAQHKKRVELTEQLRKEHQIKLEQELKNAKRKQA